ncbi:APG6-domain-containing protein [Ascobolus immersus RN42]|uniref:APG6-domain-containing protein n=1 Tax=Ascobolus immersus RN42 TaxID=1160509 RepID=A0A3N4I5K2_ASCIM|nr:APG6-domain-containing protein [Ascobolus immersus RN42]
MICQKCRSPLKLHHTVEDQLESVGLSLITGSTGTTSTTGKAPQQTAPPPGKSPFPPDRREHYNQALSTSSTSPLYKRTVPGLTASKDHLRHGGQLSNNSPQNNRHRQLQQQLNSQNPAESYVLLTESQVALPQLTNNHDSPLQRTGSRRGGEDGKLSQSFNTDESSGDNNLSQRIGHSTRIFEVLSARTDIDHPICTECTEVLLEGMQKKLQHATRERDAYIAFLKQVNNSIPTQEEIDDVNHELEKLSMEEEEALRALEETERENEAVKEEIRRLEEESRQLDEEETEFWRSRNEFSLDLEEFQNERDSVNLQYDHDSKQLERLQRTNVYNDTFCIGHDGYFGTINGLRLGRLPNQQVDWAEINAAWGQTCLLLATISEKLNFTFRNYRLLPLGSYSRIEKIEPPVSASSSVPAPKPTAYDLFSSGDLPLGRVFYHRRFDTGMVCFLECLRQLGEFVESRDSTLKLPYAIVKDRIGDAGIRLAFNRDEEWTRACKYTLTCAKFLLAHASNVGHGRG